MSLTIIFTIVWFISAWFVGKLFFTKSPGKSGDIKNSNRTEHIHQTVTYIDSSGYRRFSDSGKLVHRWIVEKRIGRRLYNFEIVHHKDRNKLNNNLENLELMSREEHNEIHKEYLMKIGVLERN